MKTICLAKLRVGSGSEVFIRIRKINWGLHGSAYVTLVGTGTQCHCFKQCCGARAGGAEIILGPGAGAENKF